jgi:pimeloyl-ACP methyl ester carboxylesterase
MIWSTRQTSSVPPRLKISRPIVTLPVLILRAAPLRIGALSDEGKSALTAGIPHARLVEFDGVGHLIHGERPKEFVQAVEEFLG